MAILDRYIGKTWISLLALCLSGFVSIYLIIDLIENIPRFLRSGSPATDIVLYFILKFPEMISRTATFSTLMATLLTLGLLSRDSEIIAMRSCGISLLRISLPLLVLGVVSSILLLINAELILPHSYARTQMIHRTRINTTGNRLAFKRNNIWFRSKSMILQARLFEPEKKMLSGVVVWTVDSSMNPISRIDADTAVYHEGHWILHSAVQKNFLSSTYLSKKVPSMTLDLALRLDDLNVLGSDADNMSIRALHEYAENLRLGGYQAYRYLTLMHSKISSSFAPLVMVLLGIPFATRSSRNGGIARGIGASIGIGFTYFVVNAVLLSFGRSGVLPPVVAAWGSNFLFMLSGIWLALTVNK